MLRVETSKRKRVIRSAKHAPEQLCGVVNRVHERGICICRAQDVHSMLENRAKAVVKDIRLVQG